MEMVVNLGTSTPNKILMERKIIVLDPIELGGETNPTLVTQNESLTRWEKYTRMLSQVVIKTNPLGCKRTDLDT